MKLDWIYSFHVWSVRGIKNIFQKKREIYIILYTKLANLIRCKCLGIENQLFQDLKMLAKKKYVKIMSIWNDLSFQAFTYLHQLAHEDISAHYHLKKIVYNYDLWSKTKKI